MKTYLKKFIAFIANILTDQKGNPSSKRISGFAVTFLFVYMTLKSMSPEVAAGTVNINMEIYWGVFSAMLAIMGMVLSEFRKGIPGNKSEINDKSNNKG